MVAAIRKLPSVEARPWMLDQDNALVDQSYLWGWVGDRLDYLQAVSLASAFSFGLGGGLAGIGANEPLGKMMARDFPNVPKSAITSNYEFDTINSVLWIKAGELTDELDEILKSRSI